MYGPTGRDYLSVDQLKQAIGGDSFDSADDELLQMAVSAASRQIDEFRGDQFWRQAQVSERVFVAEHPDVLWTGDFATTDGLEVKTWTGTVWAPWAPTDWQAEPLRRHSERAYTRLVAVGTLAFPVHLEGRRGMANVKVTAKWGWPAIPAEVTMACQILAVDAWKSKDLMGGVAGFGDLGTIRISAFNPQAKALLRPFKLPLAP